MPPASLVTTVPIEYLNYFAAWRRKFRLMSSASANSMLSSSILIVVPLTVELFQAAVDLYAARLDKGYSLRNCISMVAMRRQGLIESPANDQHFDREGFRALFRDS